MSEYTIPNLKNACKVLQMIADSQQPLTMSHIADTLSLPRSTVFRILTTLCEQGWLFREEKSYRLGGALIGLGRKAINSSTINQLARPFLKEVTELTGETSQLAMLSGKRTVILEVEDSPHPLAAHSRPGTEADIHCSASGKVLMAFGSESDTQKVLGSLSFERHTGKTITDRSAFESELERIRSAGYAIDEQEYHEGIRCIAVPVFENAQSASYSIGITASTHRFTRRKIKGFAKILQDAATQLGSHIA
ncbi:IclR family transcriptional regulator [Pelagicoccus sp. SDUM812003]|uniref:IclR family transcriptional regulator n=1 Tax=Pelagicoccus sp. SDUM812003 TaxID=3041267 RepID=UPI00280F591A|nr:IclR family transcriptional regulator [Pelagicoccus sp. SDUM812003]MDQ8202635.1 IclR family transcriptional regulator [Pelagicoccus sp. SDUM812003]